MLPIAFTISHCLRQHTELHGLLSLCSFGPSYLNRHKLDSYKIEICHFNYQDGDKVEHFTQFNKTVVQYYV